MKLKSRYRSLLSLLLIGLLFSTSYIFNRLQNKQEVQAQTTDIPTEQNFKVAFVGDSGDGNDFYDNDAASNSVMELVRDEGADLVMHQGDFSYGSGDDITQDWVTGINEPLGSSFPYLGSQGNHDDWGDTVSINGTSMSYASFFRDRLSSMGLNPSIISDSHSNYSVAYRGLKMVFNREGGDASFSQNVLSGDNHIWKVCSWHHNRNDFQAGGKGDGVDLQTYRNCLDAGAIIATGHEHSYSRTCTLTDSGSWSESNRYGADCSLPSVMQVGPNKSFIFVSGLAGASKRDYHASEHDDDGWWSTIYTSDRYCKNNCTLSDLSGQNRGNDISSYNYEHGALFIEFYVDGDPYKARGYFKNINGDIIDEFTIYAEGAGEIPTPTEGPTPTLLPTATTGPSPTPVATDGVILTPTDDTWVAEGSSSNHGDESSMAVDGSPVETSYIKFNLPDLGVVNNATLRLYIVGSSSSNQDVFYTQQSWNEDTLTSNFTGSKVADLTGGSSGNWVEVDVTSAVTSGIDPLTFIIAADDPKSDNGDGLDISTKEGNNPPELVITSSTGSPSPTPGDGDLIGDANGDDRVDGIDFTIWLNHYNTTTSNGATDGDFNGDTNVDGVDFTLWLNNYGTNTSTPEPTSDPTDSPTATNTPEPRPTSAETCSDAGGNCIQTSPGNCGINASDVGQLDCQTGHRCCVLLTESTPTPTIPQSDVIRVPQDYSTIQTAVNAANSGNVIRISAGTYAGFTVDKQITIEAEEFDQSNPRNNNVVIDGRVVVNGNWDWDNGPVIRGLSLTGGISDPFVINGPATATLEYSHVDGSADNISFEGGGGIIRGNIIENPGDDNIDVDQQSKSILVEDNIMLNSGNDGIEIRQHDVDIAERISFTMRNNRVEGSNDHGLQIMDYDNFSNRLYRVENNLILNSGESGIGIVPSSNTDAGSTSTAPMPEPLYAVNNTFIGNRAGITGGANLIAINNIFQSNSFDLGDITGDSIVMYSLFASAPNLNGSVNLDQQSTIVADPQFTNNYELQSGSPAIDAGLAQYQHTYTYDGSLGGSQKTHTDYVINLSSGDYSGDAPDLGWIEFGL